MKCEFCSRADESRSFAGLCLTQYSGRGANEEVWSGDSARAQLGAGVRVALQASFSGESEIGSVRSAVVDEGITDVLPMSPDNIEGALLPLAVTSKR